MQVESASPIPTTADDNMKKEVIKKAVTKAKVEVESWYIVNPKNVVVGKAASSKAARRAVDKKDAAYGGSVHRAVTAKSYHSPKGK